MHHARKLTRWALLFALLSVVSALACGWALRNLQPGTAMRVVLAMVPVIPTALYVLAMVGATRTLDELHQRIQLEAVTFAFVASLIASLAYGMLQKSGFFLQWPWDWEGIWAMLIGFWFIGTMISTRKYAGE